MGGVPVKEVFCKDYVDGDVLDAQMKDYIVNGLMDETVVMADYSYIFWFMWIYNTNTLEIISTAEVISLDYGLIHSPLP